MLPLPVKSFTPFTAIIICHQIYLMMDFHSALVVRQLKQKCISLCALGSRKHLLLATFLPHALLRSIQRVIILWNSNPPAPGSLQCFSSPLPMRKKTFLREDPANAAVCHARVQAASSCRSRQHSLCCLSATPPPVGKTEDKGDGCANSPRRGVQYGRCVVCVVPAGWCRWPQRSHSATHNTVTATGHSQWGAQGPAPSWPLSPTTHSLSMIDRDGEEEGETQRTKLVNINTLWRWGPRVTIEDTRPVIFAPKRVG